MYTVQSKKTVMFPFRSVETETVSISVQLETGETFNETIIEWQLDCVRSYYPVYIICSGAREYGSYSYSMH